MRRRTLIDELPKTAAEGRKEVERILDCLSLALSLPFITNTLQSP